MPNQLRVLNLEDNENDSILLQRHLTRAGYSCALRQEQTRTGFAAAIREQEWDVILADYFLPGFTALDALEVAKECGADIPFIVVSGAVGEQAAVNLLREGAADYVMKDSMSRLVPAISREMQKAEERRRRRDAEAALRESEMRLRGILENSPNVVFMKDTNGRYILVNRCYEEVLGLSASEICGKSDASFFPPEYVAQYMQNEARVSEAGVPMQFEETFPFRDGIHTRLANRFPLYDDSGNREGVCAICTDITDRKRSEESLRHTEKLAAAGRLAASIAHEINNPLEALMNLVYLLRDRPELERSTRSLLQMAEQELNRVSHIARQSLAFYHESSNPTTFDLADVLRNLSDLYSHKLRKRDLSLQLQVPPACLMHGMEGEVRQVFSNLLANAIDASRPQGRITIRARKTGMRSGNPGVRVTVADTGVGIPRESISRIFDAFFTTKSDGTGTGLGLWVSRNILQKHNAAIRLRSSTQPGSSGTVFTVLLPTGVPLNREYTGKAPLSVAASPQLPIS